MDSALVCLTQFYPLWGQGKALSWALPQHLSPSSSSPFPAVARYHHPRCRHEACPSLRLTEISNSQLSVISPSIHPSTSTNRIFPSHSTSTRSLLHTQNHIFPKGRDTELATAVGLKINSAPSISFPLVAHLWSSDRGAFFVQYHIKLHHHHHTNNGDRQSSHSDLLLALSSYSVRLFFLREREHRSRVCPRTLGAVCTIYTIVSGSLTEIDKATLLVFSPLHKQGTRRTNW